MASSQLTLDVNQDDWIFEKSYIDMFREPKPGYAEIMTLVDELNPQYPETEVVEAAIKKLFKDRY